MLRADRFCAYVAAGRYVSGARVDEGVMSPRLSVAAYRATLIPPSMIIICPVT